jgi:hypothetical protein
MGIGGPYRIYKSIYMWKVCGDSALDISGCTNRVRFPKMAQTVLIYIGARSPFQNSGAIVIG